MKPTLAALVAALVIPAAALAAPATTVLPAGQGAELVFVHPAGWHAKASHGAHGGNVTFVAADQGDFRIVIEAMRRVAGMPATDAELEAGVRRSGEAMLPTATQTALEITRVKGEQASGYLYHLTDRNPEKGAGDYRELRGGAVAVGPWFLTVEVLTHSDDEATVAEALATLAGITYREGAARP